MPTHRIHIDNALLSICGCQRMDRQTCLCLPAHCNFVYANISSTVLVSSSPTCNWHSSPHFHDHYKLLLKIARNLPESNWSHSQAHNRSSMFFPHMHTLFHIWARLIIIVLWVGVITVDSTDIQIMDTGNRKYERSLRKKYYLLRYVHTAKISIY